MKLTAEAAQMLANFESAIYQNSSLAIDVDLTQNQVNKDKSEALQMEGIVESGENLKLTEKNEQWKKKN